MKSLLLSLFALLAFQPAAFGWAIILNSPDITYFQDSDKEAIKQSKVIFKKLDFLSGVIMVSAPKPMKNMRFASPGQDASELIPVLRKLGYKVTVSFSKTLPKEQGFLLNQLEDGSREMAVVINTAHPKYDPEKLVIEVPEAESGAESKEPR